ncbi:MAG: aspartate kinase [Longimicrobiales bacterium]
MSRAPSVVPGATVLDRSAVGADDIDGASGAAGADAGAIPVPPPVVHKFGGTSVADASRIARLPGILASEPGPHVVVVSALRGVTDLLVRIAGALRGDPGPVEGWVDELRERHVRLLKELLEHHAGDGREASEGDDPSAPGDATADELEGVLGRIRSAGESDWSDRPGELDDEIVALGEDLSARLVTLAFRLQGIPAETVDAREVVRTDARFGAARPDEEAVRELARRHILSRCERGVVPVIGGFMGATADGRTTTLGRGGSDYTAALLGGALGGQEINIWTDVDGILSGDPRAVDNAATLPEMGFEEAVELSYFGARVIHPGAAKHAVSRGLVVRIRNTFNPSGTGTRILADRRGITEIAAVAYKPDVALIKVRSHPSALPYGFLARVFDVLARHHLPVDLVATSHSSTAFTIDVSQNLEVVREELSDFAEVEILSGLATVTVVGRGLMAEPGTDALVFGAVKRTPVHLISQASDVSLSFVVDQTEAPALVRRLHLTLIEFRDEEKRAWIG